MLKYILISCFYFFPFLAYSDSCLTKEEVRKVKSSIETINDYYGDVPSNINCDRKGNKLQKLACTNKNLLLMFDLESKSSVYAYENATKQETNHLKFKNGSNWDKYSNIGSKELGSLCYDLKNNTSTNLGGESPYLETHSKDSVESFFIQTNDHGMVLQANKKQIYLGNNCDAASSLSEKGYWYLSKNKYVVNLKEKIIEIDYVEGLKINEAKCSRNTRNKIKTLEIKELDQVSTQESTVVVEKSVAATQKNPAIEIPSKPFLSTKIKSPESNKTLGGSLPLSLFVPLLGLIAFRLS